MTEALNEGGNKGKRERAAELQAAVKKRKLPWFLVHEECEESKGKAETLYPRFRLIKSSSFPSDTSQRVSSALHHLKDANLFRRDLVWVKGKLIQTRVRRVLLGEPGMSYRYKGLRLFAIPWRCPDGQDVEEWRKSGVNSAAEDLYLLSKLLQDKALTESATTTPNGALYRYNVTLINLLDPSDEEDYDHAAHLRPEPYYGMGPMAVSWHSDDGVVEGSSISVYNCIQEIKEQDSETDFSKQWRLGLKVAWDVDTPAVAIPMRDGEAYAMLDGFNERNQHCVLSGSSLRFSSTHRVVDDSTSSLHYIQERCGKALEQWKLRAKLTGEELVEMLRVVQEVETELESEWLAQFYFQGKQHSLQNIFWAQEIRCLQHQLKDLQHCTLESLSWVLGAEDLEGLPLTASRTIELADRGEGVREKIRQILVGGLEDRSCRRLSWTACLHDAATILCTTDCSWQPNEDDRLGLDTMERILQRLQDSEF